MSPTVVLGLLIIFAGFTSALTLLVVTLAAVVRDLRDARTPTPPPAPVPAPVVDEGASWFIDTRHVRDLRDYFIAAGVTEIVERRTWGEG